MVLLRLVHLKLQVPLCTYFRRAVTWVEPPNFCKLAHEPTVERCKSLEVYNLYHFPRMPLNFMYHIKYINSIRLVNFINVIMYYIFKHFCQSPNTNSNINGIRYWPSPVQFTSMAMTFIAKEEQIRRIPFFCNIGKEADMFLSLSLSR
jgi:hypothetical protein